MKQHSNKITVNNIKRTKQKRTSTWCNHQWPNTSYQRETKKLSRNNIYHRRQWNILVLIGRNRKSMKNVQNLWPTLPKAWRINRRIIPYQWVRKNRLHLRHCQTTTLHKSMRIHRVQKIDYFRPQRFLHRHITRRYNEKTRNKYHITIYKECTI